MKRPILSLALVVVAGSMALTACKKSGGGGGTPIVGVEAKPTQPAEYVETQTQGQLEGEHDEVEEQGNPQNSKPEVAADDECDFGGENICDDEETKTGAPSPINKNPKTPKGEDDTGAGTDTDPDLADPGQATTTPVKIPGVRWLSRYYTGASGDGYRDHLTAVMTARMAKAKNRGQYLRNAEAITRAKAIVQDGAIQVTLDYTESGGNRISILGGAIDSRGAAHLRLMNNSAKKSKGAVFGSRSMSGVAICADQTSACRVVVLRLTVGENKVPLWIITRTTNANISIAPRFDFGGSSQARLFYNYFINTPLRILESVNTVIVDSFEVINGISGMKITTLMQDNQVVSARGLLLAPRESILTNVVWEKDLELEDLVLSMDARSGFKSALQSSVKSVRLITNDGRKEFTLNYAFTGGEDQDIIYSRMQPALIDIAQVGQIFQSMKVGSEL